MINAWEYEDFEFDNRVQNLMWTICGDYGEEMALSEKSNLSQNIALYNGITAGGRRRYINWKLVDQYVAWRVSQHFRERELQWMVYLSANIMVVNLLKDERPGILDIQKKACEEMVSLLKQPVSNTFCDGVEFTLYQILAENKVTLNKPLVIFAKRVIEQSKVITTEELIQCVDTLYIHHFSPSRPEALALRSIRLFDNHGHKNVKTESFIKNAVEAMLSNECFSEQVQNDTQITKAEALYLDQDQIDQMHDKVDQICGPSYLKDYEVRRIENILCKGPHRDCKLRFTDGVIRGKSKSEQRVGLAEKRWQKNKERYLENSQIYEQTIQRLKSKLAQTLEREKAKYFVCSDTGSINPSKLWKVGKAPDLKLFKKVESNDKGNFVVDLLIDNSFSQSLREYRVAIQAYIIARALLGVGIPCRVTGFYCFMDFSILKRYRDYDDSIKATENIFEYSCEGSNRDGLAVKAISSQLYERKEENKILIVLSDGKPNDMHLVNRDAVQTFRGQKSYSGSIAAADTAKEIRIVRQRGIFVLGVYTGEVPDLPVEKTIFGNDFFYARDIHRFADIVAKYLKQIITM